MSTYDNAPPPDGWEPPPGQHCGQLCVDLACPVCGDWLPKPEPHLVLGEN